jgi:pimeloyl-ACP methyl ester carboxylesterase
VRELTFAAPDGVRLAAADWGGSGRDVLLLHGGGGNLAGWIELVELLRDDFRLAAFDHRAHGASEVGPPPYAYDDVRYDTDAAIRALGLEEPLLVGHSLGAALALRHAAEHGGVAGVVALDGPAAWRPGETRAKPVYTEEELRERGFGWSGTDDKLEARLAVVDGRAEQAEVRRAHRRGPDGLLHGRPTIEFLIAPAPSGTYPYTTALYKRIACPVLLLNAAAGLYVDKRALLEEVEREHPHVTVEWLECDHSMHFAAPTAVASRIRAFAGELG